MKIALTVLSISIVALFVAVSAHGASEYRVDPGTHANCLTGALQARKGFKGTEFEHWNFYETCLLNIECANPMPVCPVEEIKKASQFFNEI